MQDAESERRAGEHGGPPDREGQAFVADIHRRTAQGGLIAVASEVARLAIQFLALAILARLLEPGDFGLFAMAAVLTGFAGLFTDFGLSTATIQRRDLTPGLVSGLFYLNIGFGIATTLAVIALAPVAAWVFDEPQVAMLVVMLAVPIPLIAAGRQHAALLRREMRWRSSEAVRLVAQACGAVAAITAALMFDAGPWALVTQAWVSAGLELIALWVVMSWRPGRVDDWRAVRSALGFGINLMLFSLINFFHRQSDDVMIGWRWGASELGFYTRAYALLSIPLQLVRGPLSAVFVPALSRLQDDPKAWAKLYVTALQATLIATVPLSFLLILLAPEVVGLLFGPGWDQAATIFRLLSVSIVAQLVMSSTGWLWISMGQTREMLHWAMFSVPLLILGMACGLPYGAVGLAAAYATSFCLLTPACTWFATRRLPIGFIEIYKGAIAPILAGLIAFGVALMLPEQPNAFARIATVTLVYLPVYLAAALLLDAKALGRMFRLVDDVVRAPRIEEKP